MRSRILTLADFEEWNNLWIGLPVLQRDVYYSPSYYSLYENKGDGKTICFVFESENDYAIYPFLINSVNKLGYDLDKQYYDIQGAYGYNGVATTTYEREFQNKFFSAFTEFCTEYNIIAEFIRYNPVIENHQFERRFKPLYILDNVLIDLTADIESIWSNSFDNGVRKAVKKGQRNELIYQGFLGDNIDSKSMNEFLEIYKSTMDRNKADGYYYFTDDFFKELFTELRSNLFLGTVKKGEKTISVELDLIGASTSYGFLGGTLADFYNLSPNSFLRFELIKDFKKMGICRYSIGGGVAKEDSVYKYKKSFSRNIENKFYIGKIIHNPNIYWSIINQWEAKSINHDDNKLLRYREI